MNKLISLVLVLSMLCIVTACAAEYAPVEGVVITSDIPDGIYAVGFSIDDFEEDNGLYVCFYEEQRYDAVDVSKIEAGDQILFMDNLIDVEVVETDGENVLINSGVGNANGITLTPAEGGTYMATDTVYPIYGQLAVCSLPFAEKVFFTHWNEDEEGNVAEEPETKNILSVNLRDTLVELGDLEAYPESSKLTVVDGEITALELCFAK